MMSKFGEILHGVVNMHPIQTSFADLARRIRVVVEEESKKPSPDNTLISVLSDSGRAINELLVDKEKHHKEIWDRIKGGDVKVSDEDIIRRCVEVAEQSGDAFDLNHLDLLTKYGRKAIKEARHEEAQDWMGHKGCAYHIGVRDERQRIIVEIKKHVDCRSFHKIEGRPATCLDVVLYELIRGEESKS